MTPTALKRASFSLTPEQRKAIFAGDHTAIKFKEGQPKPNVEAGQVIVLAMSRGGQQFLEKSEEKRIQRVADGRELLTEIPSKPTVWIILKEPKLRNARWVVEFEAHDHRESTRTLAAAPTGNRQPGLKTRQKRRVAKRGVQKPSSMSEDTARGYGGGGKSTVDEREGVDDATLDDYARRVAEENTLRQTKNRMAGHAMAEEIRLARLRKRLVTKLQAESAVKRRAERVAKRLRKAA